MKFSIVTAVAATIVGGTLITSATQAHTVVHPVTIITVPAPRPATMMTGDFASLPPQTAPIAVVPLFVTLALDKVTVAGGPAGRGETIVTYPFSYRKPLRLKNDIRTFLHKVPAGSVGFDVGDFATTIGLEHVMCFFRMDQSRPYAVPECFRDIERMGIHWGTAMVSVNVPSQMSYGDPVGGIPDVDTTDVVIAHDFAFQLVFQSWSQTTVRLQWQSEGVSYANAQLPVNADGTATLIVQTGTITLTRDAADPAKVDIAFAPKAPAPPAAEATPVTVDGVVYSPAGK